MYPPIGGIWQQASEQQPEQRMCMQQCEGFERMALQSSLWWVFNCKRVDCSFIHFPRVSRVPAVSMLHGVDDHLSCALVFHRKLGSEDESSTEDEQRERILFYYPPDVSISNQLNKLSMLEGLIDFSKKFSPKENIEYVDMENDIWGFLEVEPDIWIVVALKQSPIHNPTSNVLPFRQVPNGRAIVRTLQRMYQLYYTFHGGLERALVGIDGKGWETIEAIRAQKKRIRKLELKLRQFNQDLETAKEGRQVITGTGDDEEISVAEEAARAKKAAVSSEGLAQIAQCETQVKQTSLEIDGENQKLFRLLESGKYTPLLLIEHIWNFMLWYLSTGELSYACIFHSIHGQLIEKPPPTALQYVIRMRQAAEESSGGLCTGCLIIDDGACVWSDFDGDTSLAICDFIRLQENKSTRESYNLLMTLSAAGIDFVPPGKERSDTTSGNGRERTNDEDLLGSGTMKNVMRRLSVFTGGNLGKRSDYTIAKENWQKQEESWGKYMSKRMGFISESWQVVNATALGFPPEIPHRDRRSSPARYAQGVSRKDVSYEQGENEGVEYDVLGSHCDNPLGLWSPNVFACGHRVVSSLAKMDEAETEKVASSKKSESRLGKLIVYRQSKMIVVLLIKDWEEHKLEPPRQLYISPVSLNPANVDAINMKALSLRTQQDGDGNTEDAYGVRIATLCAFLQQALAPEIKAYETAVATFVDTQKTLPPGVQILCYNKSTKSLQRLGYGVPAAYNPLAIWPYKLGLKKSFLASPSSRKSSGSAGGGSGNDSRSSSPRFGTSNKERSSRMESMDEVERIVSDRIIQMVSIRFPPPPPVLAGLTDPAFADSFNDFVESFHMRPDISEHCTRLASSSIRGGIWGIARRFGDREIYITLEGCATLNEMNDLLNKVDLAKTCDFVS